MRLTPLEIRQQQFPRVLRGLDSEEVENFLAAVANEFESVIAEHKELRQRVVELEEKIAEYRSMEKALRDTLLTAERVMAEAKESAQREAALIVREAELAAQRATARLAQDLVDMRHELSELRRIKDTYLSRVRWLLRSHLEMIEGHTQEFADIDAGLRPPTGAREPAPSAAAGSTRPERTAPDSAAVSPRPPGEVAPPRPTAEPPVPRPALGPGAPPPAAERWRNADAAALGGLPPADDLADVLRPIAPDGSYEQVPGAYPARSASAEELAQAVRRAERLAAEARAAAERHGAGTAETPGPGSESGWSMDRFREGLGGGPQP